jgi:hypothetical protein
VHLFLQWYCRRGWVTTRSCSSRCVSIPCGERPGTCAWCSQAWIDDSPRLLKRVCAKHALLLVQTVLRDNTRLLKQGHVKYAPPFCNHMFVLTLDHTQLHVFTFARRARHDVAPQHTKVLQRPQMRIQYTHLL